MSNVFNLQVMMIAIMLVGAYLRKIGIIQGENKKVMTDLMVNLFLPCNIVIAFCAELSKEVLAQGLMICGISALIQLFCIFLGKILYNKYEKEEKIILQYGTIC